MFHIFKLETNFASPASFTDLPIHSINEVYFLR